MERVYLFLPSILILGGVAAVTFFYLKWVIKYFGEDNFKSIEWHEKNKWKIPLIVGAPWVIVFAPAVEELIFRAPLIIIFSTVSSDAWYGIFVSSGLFALAHLYEKKIWIYDILDERKNGNCQSDDVMTEMNRFYQENIKMVGVRQVLNIIFVLPLGILAGYYSIKCQSIWAAFAIHAIWNLVMPPIILFLGILLLFFVFVFVFLWDKIRQ